MKLRTSLIMAAGFVLVVFTVASTLLPHDLRAADFGHHLSPELAAAILVGRLVVLAAVIAAGWWVLRRGLRPSPRSPASLTPSSPVTAPAAWRSVSRGPRPRTWRRR